MTERNELFCLIVGENDYLSFSFHNKDDDNSCCNENNSSSYYSSYYCRLQCASFFSTRCQSKVKCKKKKFVTNWRRRSCLFFFYDALATIQQKSSVTIHCLNERVKRPTGHLRVCILHIVWIFQCLDIFSIQLHLRWCMEEFDREYMLNEDQKDNNRTMI